LCKHAIFGTILLRVSCRCFSPFAVFCRVNKNGAEYYPVLFLFPFVSLILFVSRCMGPLYAVILYR
jgi:hypothetical protein